MKPKPETPKKGQECVWDYPRPPRIERTKKQIKVVHQDIVICNTTGAFRILETSHPPVYYMPPEDFIQGVLQSSESNMSFCEWKGSAKYFDINLNNLRIERAAWCYPNPSSEMKMIKDYIAVYAFKVDGCYVDGEKAKPQEGNFYGGWITKDLTGPFKGGPGTMGW